MQLALLLQPEACSRVYHHELSAGLAPVLAQVLAALVLVARQLRILESKKIVCMVFIFEE